MQPRKGDFEGVLLVDKPKGITSHGVVNRLRRQAQYEKDRSCGNFGSNGHGPCSSC